MGSWSCGLCCCCGVCEHSRLAAPVLFLVLGCADTCPGECAGSFQLVPCGSWPQDYLMKGSLLDSRSWPVALNISHSSNPRWPAQTFWCFSCHPSHPNLLWLCEREILSVAQTPCSLQVWPSVRACVSLLLCLQAALGAGGSVHQHTHTHTVLWHLRLVGPWHLWPSSHLQALWPLYVHMEWSHSCHPGKHKSSRVTGPSYLLSVFAFSFLPTPPLIPQWVLHPFRQ